MDLGTCNPGRDYGQKFNDFHDDGWLIHHIDRDILCDGEYEYPKIWWINTPNYDKKPKILAITYHQEIGAQCGPEVRHRIPQEEREERDN